MQTSPERGDPVEQIGTALMRATGILSALSACQDHSRSSFAVPEPFVVQAILALEGFINDARNAYFDLTTREVSSDEDAHQAGPARQEYAAAPQHVPQKPLAAKREDGASVLPDLYAFLGHDAALAAHAQIAEGPDGFASSYEALMRKLTAAEVFAAERGLSHEESDSPLLPLLQSLRQDLQRLRAA